MERSPRPSPAPLARGAYARTGNRGPAPARDRPQRTVPGPRRSARRRSLPPAGRRSCQPRRRGRSQGSTRMGRAAAASQPTADRSTSCRGLRSRPCPRDGLQVARRAASSQRGPGLVAPCTERLLPAAVFGPSRPSRGTARRTSVRRRRLLHPTHGALRDLPIGASCPVTDATGTKGPFDRPVVAPQPVRAGADGPDLDRRPARPAGADHGVVAAGSVVSRRRAGPARDARTAPCGGSRSASGVVGAGPDSTAWSVHRFTGRATGRAIAMAAAAAAFRVRACHGTDPAPVARAGRSSR